MSLKHLLKRILLKHKKNILLDSNSSLNYDVISHNINSAFKPTITNSVCEIGEIGEGCSISDARIYGNVTIGRFVDIVGPGTIVKALGQNIHIKSFSSIGQHVSVLDFSHMPERITSNFIHHKIFGEHFSSDLTTKGAVVIEEDVWIGSNAVILPGVIVGRGSVVGAGSVVSRDVPRYSVVGGNPAVILSKRFSSSTISYLEELEWWNWDTDRLIQSKKLFGIDINKL